MPTNKKRSVSSYSVYAREQASRAADMTGKTITELETFIWTGLEYEHVDTILSWCRRNAVTDSASRLIHSEFELLVEEGVVPIFAHIGNRRYFPTSFLDVVCNKMNDDLTARLSLRASSNKAQITQIASELAKNPELLQIIAELISDGKTHQAL